MKSLCVFASSSDAVAPTYFAAATAVGVLIAQRQFILIYGGGKIGLMGALARAVHQHRGRVVGIIPHYLRKKEVAYEAADELVVVSDLRERKALMEARADAFLVLPGGFGTLEETLEILTLKQLHQHDKPIVLLNINNFFDPLIGLFKRLSHEGFVKPEYRETFYLAPEPEEAFQYLSACP